MTTPAHKSSQSFLGDGADLLFASCKLGIVGLGGGGSHVVQQVAHIGFKHVIAFDYDRIEERNLNRLVGATIADLPQGKEEEGTPKGIIAKRLYHGLQPEGFFNWIDAKWQDAKETLRSCDIVISCLDDIQNRLDIEKTCRRYLIPLIDIGMDVQIRPGESPQCFGQVAVSLPGRHCFHCLGFRDQTDGPKYGDAGSRPQVIWPNGVLASSAVGIAVDMLTGWTKEENLTLRLQYNGNTHTLTPMPQLSERLKFPCTHFTPEQVGDPLF